MTRLAPLAARFSHVAAPMPLEPPVTMASLPSRTRGALVVRLVEADLKDMTAAYVIRHRKGLTGNLDRKGNNEATQVCIRKHTHVNTYGGLAGWAQFRLSW